MQEKKCIACKSMIDGEALKCPRCKQIQSTLANLHNRPSFSIMAFGLFVLFVVWAIYGVVTSPGDEKYDDYITGSSFEISVANVDENSSVSCFSTFHNNSEWRWSDFSLAAEFYSVEGKLIDLHTERYFDISIRANGSGVFRVTGNPNAEVSDYSSCVIKVLDAL